MSQDPSNLGYYNTYHGDAGFNSMGNHGQHSGCHQGGQSLHVPVTSWPLSVAGPSTNEIPWRPFSYQWSNENWYDQDVLSQSDETSEASGLDSNIAPDLERSESVEFSDIWEQEPFQAPFSSPNQLPGPTGELFNSIGSGFAVQDTNMVPLRLPPCASATPDKPNQSYEHMLGDMDVEDTVSMSTMTASTTIPNPHPSMSGPPYRQTSSSSSADQPISGEQRKANQTKSNDATSSKKPARANSTRQRLFCDACRDSKDYSRGFRGEHELARHYAQKHSKHKQVWKCFDLSPDRLMRNCERCKTGHTYGSSYGGAEHFRRKHTAMFGNDMMEWLRGKNRRRALSGARLVEEGWLQKVWVTGDDEPSGQQQQQQVQEQGMPAMQSAIPCIRSPQELIPNGGMGMAHIQPILQPHMPMHDASTAWAQHPYQDPYQQHQQQQQHQHQQLSTQHRQWHSAMY